MFKHYLFLASFFVAIQNSAASATGCEVECVEKNSWAIGIAVGFAELENPVHDGKEFDFNVLPSFYYYADKFYIENTMIGYTLHENESMSIDLKGAFNKDGVYFNDSFLNTLIIADFITPGWVGGEVQTASGNDVERDLSYMGGMSADFFLSDSLQISVGAAHDITDVHNGFQVNLMFSNRYENGSFLLQTGMGVEYRSADLNDYYYGLSDTEVITILEGYQADGGINANLSIMAAYRINQSFSVIAHYKYEKLASELVESPLIEDSYSDFYFIGLSYQFGSE